MNRIKNVAKVFLATNSDYSYTEVSRRATLITDDISMSQRVCLYMLLPFLMGCK